MGLVFSLSGGSVQMPVQIVRNDTRPMIPFMLFVPSQISNLIEDQDRLKTHTPGLGPGSSAFSSPVSRAFGMLRRSPFPMRRFDGLRLSDLTPDTNKRAANSFIHCATVMKTNADIKEVWKISISKLGKRRWVSIMRLVRPALKSASNTSDGGFISTASQLLAAPSQDPAIIVHHLNWRPREAKKQHTNT